MFRTIRAALVAALLLCLPLPSLASDSNVRTDKKDLFAGTTVGVTATVTSAAFTAIGQSEHLSIQFVDAGGSTSYKLEVLCSLDETNFVKPETGGDVGTFTDQNQHVVAIVVPFCKAVKIKVTELDTGHDASITAVICSQ